MRVELSKDETKARFTQKHLKIGEGTYPTDQMTRLIELNSYFCNIATTKNELINQIYPNIVHSYTNPEWRVSLHSRYPEKVQFWQLTK